LAEGVEQRLDAGVVALDLPLELRDLCGERPAEGQRLP
jgi:hypothetical protein